MDEPAAVSFDYVNPTKEIDMLAAILLSPILGAAVAATAVWLMGGGPARRSEPLGGVLDVPSSGAGDRQADHGEHRAHHEVVHQG